MQGRVRIEAQLGKRLPEPPALKRVIFVHGLKRSGNHAVTNWLRAHAPFAYFNNHTPVYLYYRDGEPLPPPRDYQRWLSTPSTEKKRRSDPPPEQALITLEDLPPNYLPLSGIDCDVVRILIVRDPYSTFASRIRGMQTGARYFCNPAREGSATPDLPFAFDPIFVDYWEETAKECLGLTNRIEAKLPIYFDRWFTSSAYRCSIIETLGFAFTDAEFSRVPTAGGGSSFDGTSFDNRNSEMNVLDRVSDLTPVERQLLDRVLDRESVRELSVALREM